MAEEILTIRFEERNKLCSAEGRIRYIGDPNEHNVFQLAAENRHDNVKVVEALISAGAMVNQINVFGDLALNCAAAKGNLNIATYLINHSADVNLMDNNGGTPLICAVWDKPGRSPSDYEKRVSLVKLLLRKRADVNLCPPRADNPLMRAVRSEYVNFDIVKVLLEAGADVHLRNWSGQTCLLIAMSSWREAWNRKVIIELIKAGASVNVEDRDGITPVNSLVHFPRLQYRQKQEELREFIKIVTLKYYPERMDFSNDMIREANRIARECYEEVQGMESVVLDRRLTLRDFALTGSESERIWDLVFDILMQESILIYRDYLPPQFQRWYLRNKIYDKGFYIKTGIFFQRDIVFKQSLIPRFCKYLSNIDMINFIKVLENSPPARL